MRHVMMISVLAWGCGSSGSPATPSASPIDLVARPAASDVEVARVNGRPVWGTCVAAQAMTDTPQERARALRECIDFELLAQTAEQRGLAALPDVHEARRTALVDRVIADFERRYQKPSDFGPLIDKFLDENPQQQNRDELRASTYVRVPLAESAPPELEARARAFAEQIAARVTSEAGLFASHLVEAASAVPPPAGLTVEHADVLPRAAVQLHTSYATALFAIPELGRAAGPVRTKWGWDVILWTGGVPGKTRTREEFAAAAFPIVRRNHFTTWTTQLARELGIRIEIVDANLPKLDRVAAP